jgi:PIN domain nuclease of toxin-antitoxin system
VAKLPPLTRDPFDRILVSQAIVHGLTIVTPDPAVTGYPIVTMW